MKLQLKHLAPYLPYGLKFTCGEYDKHELYSLSNDGFVLFEPISESYLDYDNGDDLVKPLLHPLSRLTEPILEGGKTPMYELFNMQGFSTKPIGECVFEYNDEFQPIAKVNDGNWMLRYMHQEDAFFLNGLKDWNKKHQKSRRQFQMYKKLFQWHFDVFNLIDKNLAEPITGHTAQ